MPVNEKAVSQLIADLLNLNQTLQREAKVQKTAAWLFYAHRLDDILRKFRNSSLK